MSFKSRICLILCFHWNLFRVELQSCSYLARVGWIFLSFESWVNRSYYTFYTVLLICFSDLSLCTLYLLYMYYRLYILYITIMPYGLDCKSIPNQYVVKHWRSLKKFGHAAIEIIRQSIVSFFWLSLVAGIEPFHPLQLWRSGDLYTYFPNPPAWPRLLIFPMKCLPKFLM